jgi:hypothetical protein
LIKGEPHFYEYYKPSIAVLRNKLNKNYLYEFEIYSVFYDFLCNKSADFSNIKNIKHKKINSYTHSCSLAIELYSHGEYRQALDCVMFAPMYSNAFFEYIWALIRFLCLQKLGEDVSNAFLILKKLAYNEYLQLVTDNL